MATASKPSKKKGKKRRRNGKPKNDNQQSLDLILDQSTDSNEKFTFFFRKESPFSQWHPVEFKVDGVNFMCAEQFMMYQKALLFKDGEIAQEILKTDSPREHKALGRKVENFDPDVWNERRKDIVKRGNIAKFSQNEHLLESLKATAGTTLVEASPFDRIWGIGLSASNPKAKSRRTWRGSNLLGEILTEVREELLQSKTVEDSTGAAITTIPGKNQSDAVVVKQPATRKRKQPATTETSMEPTINTTTAEEPTTTTTSIDSSAKQPSTMSMEPTINITTAEEPTTTTTSIDSSAKQPSTMSMEPTINITTAEELTTTTTSIDSSAKQPSTMSNDSFVKETDATTTSVGSSEDVQPPEAQQIQQEQQKSKVPPDTDDSGIEGQHEQHQQQQPVAMDTQ